ncbi:MAG: hemerythrin domain-containing protein [Bradyrhizobium sp.]|nr:hemerythrin domain-containing protein [Bradyrhizobium sp.]
MPNLSLDSRDGLPDELAYLRASFPRDQWQSHANFGELSSFWLQVHDHLRKSGSQLSDVTAQFREGRLDPHTYRQAFAVGLNQFLQHLNGHHQVEDHYYFPKFRALDPRMVAGFELLEADHVLIHQGLLATAEKANAFLAAFSTGSDALRQAGDTYAAQADRLLALLMRHLADEEDLIIPAMLHHGERSVSAD